MPEPDVDAIAADLRETGVHLGPGTEDWIPPAQLDAIREAAREGGVPLQLVLVKPPERGIHGGSDLLVRVHDRGGPDGLYLGVNNLWGHRDDEEPSDPYLPDGTELNVALAQWGEVAGSDDLTDDLEVVLSEGAGEPGAPGAPYELGEGLLRVVEGLADGTFDRMVTDAYEGLRTSLDQSGEGREEGGGRTLVPSNPPGDDPEVSIGLVEGVVAVVLATALVLALRAAVTRWRGRDTRGPRTFVLPDSVLERVRAAGDEELVRRARRDVLRLGESIDAAEMTGSGNAAWASALDHYEAAGRVLPAAGGSTAHVDPLDAVGAVVLAARGQEALAAARRGRAFTPSTPCFLNPLHGRAVKDRTLEHDSRTVTAPICETCRRDLQAGRRPDLLDVVVRGTPRHYFETDREPWASTGFGALESDLVGRIHRERR